MNYDGLKNDGLFYVCVLAAVRCGGFKELESGKIINFDSSKYVFRSNLFFES